MREHTTNISSKVDPDLLTPPHVLHLLMELFAGERQKALLQQEHLLAHLAECYYCRTAVVFLLDIAQEYDRRNNNPQDAAHNLLTSFVTISHAIEACEYERLGVYAEAIVALGRDLADLRFPHVVAHLRRCPDCRSVLRATVTALTSPEATDANGEEQTTGIH